MQYRATILGNIWQPGVGLCATTRVYDADSDEDAVQRAYGAEAGDFSQVKDVHVVRFDQCDECGGRKLVMVANWDNEENQLDAQDCLTASIIAGDDN